MSTYNVRVNGEIGNITPGPSCSKLTMSLVNDSLHQMLRKYAEIFC